jgi:hypothetical protein
MIVVSFLEQHLSTAYAAGDSCMPKGTRVNTQPARATI